jgi:hypothetical protein
MRHRHGYASCALGIALLSCGNGSGGSADEASDEPCVPGHSRACECDDGSPGAQVCEPDGQGYPPCVCEAGESGGESGDSSPGTATSAGSTTTSASDGGEETTAPADESGEGGGPPTFSGTIVPIFYESCGAGDPGCHSRNAYAATADQGCRGWLALEDEALGSVIYAPPDVAGTPTGCPDMPLYDRLMQLAPWQCDPSSQYVAPASLEQSYLYQKMIDGSLCGDFDPMPPSGTMYKLTAAQMDAIAAWIMAGAPND